MPDYRRAFDPGGTFYFTLVTERRRPIFSDETARHLLAEAIRKTRRDWPFTIDAMVLLPDHLHTIWTLPSGDSDYSTRWNVIKTRFSREYRKAGGTEQTRTPSRMRQRRRGFLQRKFYEHCVREHEFEEIAAYIHLNPVKHGLVACPHAWPQSSFHRWVSDGRLPWDWECICNSPRPARPFDSKWEQAE